jgi:hypothetical protein
MNKQILEGQQSQKIDIVFSTIIATFITIFILALVVNHRRDEVIQRIDLLENNLVDCAEKNSSP